MQFCTEDDGSFTLPKWLELPGYTVCLPGEKYLSQMAKRNERVLAARIAIGCALLYRSDRLVSGALTDGSDPNRLVSACLRGHPDSELRELGATAFFSVHLDAQSEEQRVDQLRKCLERARGMGTRDAVLAGDMNSECLPGSCVRAYFTSEEPSGEELQRECAAGLRMSGEEGDEAEGRASDSALPSDEQLVQWRALWQTAVKTPVEHRMSFQRVPTGPTRSSYDHGMTEGPCVTWSLDHIFHSPRTFKLLGHWTTLEALSPCQVACPSEADEDSAASGLPNRDNPSDHLPVAAVFEVPHA